MGNRIQRLRPVERDDTGIVAVVEKDFRVGHKVNGHEVFKIRC
jgi:hypothetical protein